MNIGELDQRIVIEQRVVTREADFGAEVISWPALCQVWAKVVDAVNTRKGGEESIEQDVRMRSSLTRALIRFRNDITSDMRVHWDARNRTLQIVGIAEVGRREWLELSLEEYSVPLGTALASDVTVALQ